jgi:hypothetical protein
MQGQHKPGYRRPRTGEKRRTRQPLRIDSFPEEVRKKVQELRAAGETWEEISEASRKFAGEHLAVSTLHRWYDLRVAQAHAETMKEYERARALAASFAGKSFEKLPQAVQSGLSSAIFSLAESQDEASRGKFIKSMGDLAWLLARNRQLDQEDKRLGLEAKKLEAVVAKVQGLRKDVEKKKLSSEELARKLDEIYDLGRKVA